MAKKKGKPERGRPKKARPPAGLPGRRAMEGMMRELARSMQGDGGPHTPLDQAQDILEQAYTEPDGRRRVRLAQEALAVCPDCADAYVLLAEHAPSRKQALDLYEKAEAAGERALGPDAFREHVGHFWGLLETRPYMRARLGLAHVLWTLGRRDEAVRHLQDLLRLNPGDNQGVRYTLAGFLLFLDRDDDLARLLEQYPDEDSAAWAYTRALLAFRRHGDTPDARRLLAEAKRTNKHVPAYLTGREQPPSQQPAYYSPGDKSEALEYVAGFMAGWKDTPGAVAWLRANDDRAKKRKAGDPQGRGPTAAVQKRLKAKLAQAPDVWQVGGRQTPQWAPNAAGDLVRPWLSLVASRSNGLVLAHEMTEEPPSAELLWDMLARAMQKPMAGEPHRPTEVQARPDERWQSLAPHLEEIGVRLVESEGLDMLDAVLDDMSAHLGEGREPGLLDVPGVTPPQVAGFYEAAATFFRQAPWKKVGYESAIKVECAKFTGGPWYAVLMGQSGLTAGLALYDDLKILQAMWSQDRDDEENARRTVATTVTFGEEWEIPVADLDAAKKHGWPVARPDAYPSVFHKERGLSMRPPLAWELELMEGCLRAVPDFVSRRGQDDPARDTLTVPTAAGPLELTLSWVVGSGEAP